MTPVTPALAATLMLVRDQDQLEVLMVERHATMMFGPGALVFPGGKLEPQDLDPAWRTEAKGGNDLNVEERGLRICAIRETFEETGILLGAASPSVGTFSIEALRDRVLAGELPFRKAVDTLGVRLDLSDLAPFGRWVTPERQPIRFDAAFYIAQAPEGQQAVCDGHEIIAAEWLTPAEALALADQNRRILMRPTRANLELLRASACVATAMLAARGRTMAAYLQPD